MVNSRRLADKPTTSSVQMLRLRAPATTGRSVYNRKRQFTEEQNTIARTAPPLVLYTWPQSEVDLKSSFVDLDVC